MDQINQVPADTTGGTPEPNKPAQALTQPMQESTPLAQTQIPTSHPAPSPTPLSQLPSFAPKKSNVKLWAGVVGGILIVVIGAAMILGKTKTYKGSLRLEPAPSKEMLEDLEKAKQEAELPPLVEPTPIETPSMAAPENEELIALCTTIPGAVWTPAHKKCSFNGTNYTDESSLSAAYEASKAEVPPVADENNILQEISGFVKNIKGLATQAEQVFGALPQASDTDALIVMANKITGFLSEAKTALGSAQSLNSSLIIEENKQKAQTLLAEANQALTSIENYNNQAIPMAKEAAINKQIAEEQKQQTQTQLKSECESVPGARWNEDGDNSGCVFGKTEHPSAASPESQAIADKAKQEEAAKSAEQIAEETDVHPTATTEIAKTDESTRVAMGIPTEQTSTSELASGQEPLGAASPESEAIATIAKIEIAARSAAGDAEYIAGLLKAYPNNSEIQSANAKAQNAAATALDAFGFAKGETDPAILKTLLSKAELAAVKAATAKEAAQTAYNAEKTKEAAQNNSGGGGSPYQQPTPEPAPQTLSPSAPEQTGGGSSWSGNSGGGGGSNVIPYTGPGGGGGVKTPSSNKKASSEEPKKLLGYLETPEMWGDGAKSSTIETPEMWGDATPKKAGVGTGATGGKAYGATIQGKTGPGVLLYPVVIGAVNGLYYLARKRRKN